MKYTRKSALWLILLWTALIAIALMLEGCRTTEYVPVETVHTEYINSIDTIEKVDSFWRDRTTVVREVDSTAMVQYGIQMKEKERAWLVLQTKLERELKKEREHNTDTIILRDSIPYPVIRVVEKPPNRWQKLTQRVGSTVLLLMLLAIAGGCAWMLLRLRFRR